MAALERHVALLRGINVGGKRILPMKALATIFEEAGARDVSTYIQSGNVIFGVEKKHANTLAGAVRKAIEASFGFDVPLVIRSASELRAAIEQNPFLAEGADENALHLAFLAEKPSAKHAGALDPDRSPPDRFALHGSDLYLLCPNGIGKTKLTNVYLDKALGTVSTVRNWRTVLKLRELAEAGRAQPR